MSSSCNVRIRLPTDSDVDALAELEMRNRSDLERTGPPRPPGAWEPNTMRQRATALIAEAADGTRFAWVITVDGVIAGDISLHHVERYAMWSAGVGYMVDTAYRGRGVAGSALRLVVREAFDVLGLHRLEAGAQSWNLGSRRVLTSAGFREVGLLERHLWIDGAWRDHVLYELVAPDFTPSLPTDSGR